MIDSSLEKQWQLWKPEKIFFKEAKKNSKILCSLDKFREEDFFIHLKNKNKENQNQKNRELKIDLKRTEAYKLGLKSGLLESTEKNILLEKKINDLLLDFENSFSIFESALYSRILKIVLKISSYVIGKTVDIDESMLLKNIKQIIDKDGIFLKKPQIIVHPNNKTLIEKTLKNFLNSYKWTLSYDDSVDLNSCKVKSENGDMDATVDGRWQELCRLVYSKEEC